MNGVIQFEVGGNTYTCNFGMKAAEIFSKSLIRIEGDYGEVTRWDWFVCLIYAGLCNEDYNKIRPFTSFDDASIIADQISLDKKDEIYVCYEESKAGKEIQAKIDAMIPKEKKSEESPKKKIGKKLKSMPIPTE